MCLLHAIPNVLPRLQPLTSAGSASREFLSTRFWCIIIIYFLLQWLSAPFEDAVMSLLSSSCLAHRSGPAMRNHPERWKWLRAHRQRRQPRVCAARQKRWDPKKNPVEEQREAASHRLLLSVYDAKGDAILHVVHCQLRFKGKGSNTLESSLKNADTVAFLLDFTAAVSLFQAFIFGLRLQSSSVTQLNIQWTSENCVCDTLLVGLIVIFLRGDGHKAALAGLAAIWLPFQKTWEKWKKWTDFHRLVHIVKNLAYRGTLSGL